LKSYVLPAAVAILVALFAIQPLGTSRIGKAFGPIMGFWFLSIAWVITMPMAGIIAAIFYALARLVG
jgi:K+ transporter